MQGQTTSALNGIIKQTQTLGILQNFWRATLTEAYRCLLLPALDSEELLAGQSAPPVVDSLRTGIPAGLKLF